MPGKPRAADGTVLKISNPPSSVRNERDPLHPHGTGDQLFLFVISLFCCIIQEGDSKVRCIAVQFKKGVMLIWRITIRIPFVWTGFLM